MCFPACDFYLVNLSTTYYKNHAFDNVSIIKIFLHLLSFYNFPVSLPSASLSMDGNDSAKLSSAADSSLMGSGSGAMDVNSGATTGGNLGASGGANLGATGSAKLGASGDAKASGELGAFNADVGGKQFEVNTYCCLIQCEFIDRRNSL